MAFNDKSLKPEISGQASSPVSSSKILTAVQQSVEEQFLETTINCLPRECLQQILLEVPAGDRVKLSAVSKYWTDVIDDTWREVKNVEIVCSKPNEKPSITGSGDTVKIVSSRSMNVLAKVMEYFESRKDFLPRQSIRRFLSIFVFVSGIHPYRAKRSHLEVVHWSTSLEKLKTQFIDDELIYLISQKTNLQELSIEFNMHSYMNHQMWEPLLQLRNLKKLSLVSGMIVRKGRCIYLEMPYGSEFICKLTTKLEQLESLTLGASNRVCDITLQCLATLKNLKELRIISCVNITGESLEGLTQVEILSLTGCRIRDEGVIKLLKKNENLRKLYLGGTAITNETVRAAIEATASRTNGVLLTLDICCTNTKLTEINTTPPLLEIFI